MKKPTTAAPQLPPVKWRTIGDKNIRNYPSYLKSLNYQRVDLKNKWGTDFQFGVGFYLEVRMSPYENPKRNMATMMYVCKPCVLDNLKK